MVLEGEFLKDEKWNGNGKEYYGDTNELYFEGIYSNGKKSGKCRIIHKSKLIFNNLSLFS